MEKLNATKEGVPGLKLTSEVLRRLKTFFDKVQDLDFAVVYGSFARGDSTETSDIDLALKFHTQTNHNKFSKIIMDLAKNLQIVEDRIDILPLKEDLPIELLFKIVKDGLFVTGNPESYKKFRDKTISMYLDFKLFKEKLKLGEKYLKTITAETSPKNSKSNINK